MYIFKNFISGYLPPEHDAIEVFFSGLNQVLI